MLSALKPRHKTITDRGEQRMLLGSEQRMKRSGWPRPLVAAECR
jgi:hypothetical protein